MELLRSAPSNDELWSILGEAAFETGDMEAALVAFQRVLELRGRHFETLIYLGTVLSDMGRLEEAEAAFREAARLQPESFLPRFTLGALELSRGRPLEALGHLGAALELEELPQLWHLVGVCHLGLGHPGRAVTALRRAVEMAPNFEDAIYHLGLAYLRRGWNRLALETFRQVLDLDPHRLQYQETVRLLSLELPADLPEAGRRLVEEAEAALERGRPGVALSRFERALEAAPGNVALHATAALLASSLGRSRQALHHAHVVLAAPPEPSPYTAAAVVALLESLRHAGRRRAAHRLASRLYATGPDDLSRGLAAYELALVEAELGSDLESARELAMESLNITPRELRHYPLGALGEIALKRGHYNEAVQYLEQAVESAPRPVLLRQLAVARLATGDAAGAEAALRAAEEHPPGGLDEELLAHVHRVDTVLGGLTRQRSNTNVSRGG
jgi:tetratricopeptide (TPR) repeat protein